MELRHLRYFIMVAEERHFTRAAARLNMQQPPLSQQVRALEQELGFDLFKRHAKGVDLTAGGLVFLEEARTLLARLEQGCRKAYRVAHGIEGTLMIGFTSSTAAHPLIPKIIRAYRERYPGVELSLNEGSAREVTEDTLEKRIDIGILRAPVSGAQDLTYHPLLSEEMLLTLPIGHPLFKGTDVRISIHDLKHERLILVRRPGAPGMYASLIEACRNAGFEPTIAFEVERMLTNVSLVAAGEGISVVPASMRGVHSESVVYCRISDAQPELVAPINLVRRTFNPSTPLQNFIDLAQELAQV
ncbi:LysR substrate-binding domain-containing protein [Pseudomonas mucidolens]|uniref:Transcriptional regulator, LysR family n=1 Tax=Pseudomonas mucidolens TaxID=46679 RepID=A0A1H2P1M7_9PSED|nr:LysR substrate-binding domain-containing protein [Pseudomonas mucidolens]SDV11599.1 transcriptional regulator, LysR family [Pseudomonas mucidolens]SQH36576.1 LysR family transcriptional regulator [Pseudomonas mucidolens]